MVKKGLPLTQIHKDNISTGLKKYYETHDMSQERKDAISEGKRKFYAIHKMSQAHKDAISRGVDEYYSTHDGPWKGVKRDNKFKDTVSQTLKRTFANGHTNWNKGLSWSSEIRDRLRHGCLNSSIGMSRKSVQIEQKVTLDRLKR